MQSERHWEIEPITTKKIICIQITDKKKSVFLLITYWQNVAAEKGETTVGDGGRQVVLRVRVEKEEGNAMVWKKTDCVFWNQKERKCDWWVC